MKLDDFKKRVEEIILLSEQTLATTEHGSYHSFVNPGLFLQFRSTSLSFIKSLYGEKHPYFLEFKEKVWEQDPTCVEKGRGILRSIKDEIDGGWLFTIRGIVSAEIFSDFLEMAEYLLHGDFKDAAAVMIGSVLEEHLRQLCSKNSVSTESMKDGKSVAKKADLLNSELAAANVYNKLDQKSVTSWFDLRNKAAHGKYSEYTKEQVDIMYQGVTNFISRTAI